MEKDEEGIRSLLPPIHISVLLRHRNKSASNYGSLVQTDPTNHNLREKNINTL